MVGGGRSGTQSQGEAGGEISRAEPEEEPELPVVVPDLILKMLEGYSCYIN